MSIMIFGPESWVSKLEGGKNRVRPRYSLMRKAVDKLNNMTHPYDILGFDTCTGKYNCQDWANDVRREYYRLKTENNIQLWNNLINNR